MNLSKIAMTFGLSVVLGSSLLMAADYTERGNVPFQFTAGHVDMEAGTYEATWHSSSGILRLRNTTTGKACFISAIPKSGAVGQAKLVFHRYGSRAFLAQVWFPDAFAGQALPTSKLEREMAANSQPQIDYVAMR